MNREEILRRLDEERRALVYDGSELEILPAITRWRSTDQSHHCLIYSRLTEESADRVIEEQVAHYRAMGKGFEWKVYSHDRPGDLRERLDQRGFEVGACEAVLIYDLSRAAQWIADQSIRVERVDRLEQLPVYRRLAEEVFEKDYAFTTEQLAEAIEAGSMQHRAYIAYDGDVPASIGRLYAHPQSYFGGLYGGGTLKAHRGKHLYRATVAARGRDAMERGINYLQVDALPTSRPILERLGFEWAADTYPCEWRAQQ